ncbi:MAG: flagellar export chaperone FliS [Synergistaceae bacterium]|nr:flagellar export chaperone FliS [Synergistota bacterium]NLM72061.1 flagellar export chaperone FliS [Synergistaceae bacterium]
MDAKNTQYAQAVYLSNKINTASREQLLLITYDIGIKSCMGAESAMQAGLIDEANNNLQRAQNVIRELMVTLRVQEGDEVTTNLMRLYDFMYLMLVEANVDKDGEKVAVVRGMLEELRTTWEEAIIKLAEEAGVEKPAVIQGATPVLDTMERGTVPAGGLNVAG